MRLIAQARHGRFARIAADASTAHRRLFRRVSIDLGSSARPQRCRPTSASRRRPTDDPALAALYFNYGRYLLICSSRPGSQPANLAGPVERQPNNPPWGSKYTININTEMNYWPAESTNLRRMHRAAGRAGPRPGGDRRAHGARDVRRARLGGASQYRSVARDRADRRRAMGPVADRRRVAVHASVGAL